jgi:hypothetical protein
MGISWVDYIKNGPWMCFPKVSLQSMVRYSAELLSYNSIATPSKPTNDPELMIQRNGSGLPVFPPLDLGREGPEVVRQIIAAYFDHLWSKS